MRRSNTELGLRIQKALRCIRLRRSLVECELKLAMDESQMKRARGDLNAMSEAMLAQVRVKAYQDSIKTLNECEDELRSNVAHSFVGYDKLYADIFWLFFVEGRTVAETAEAVCLSEDGVKKATKKLRDMAAEDFPAEKGENKDEPDYA